MKDQLAPGTVVGGYRIERPLGSGGMGSVYLAKHPELPRHDALKVLSSGYVGDEGFRKRFLREAELAARLDHPSIVTIYNRGSQGAMLWIAMQYVQGDDCSVLLKRTPAGLEPATAVHIVGQVARGLDHAHKAGLLHRDIKPANILVSTDDGDDGDGQRVLLTDFGVAKGGDEASQLTAVGTVLATLAYASPEQLCGEDLDARSDQYSLAATFFHLVTGKVPYSGASTDAVIDAHFNAPPPRISQIRDGVPPAVDAVVARGLAKTPAERFATCKEFTTALRSAMAAPQNRRMPPARPAPRPGYVPGPGHPSGPQPPVASRPSSPVPRSVAPGIRGQANRAGVPAARPAPPQAAPQPMHRPGVPSGAMPRPSAPAPQRAPAPQARPAAQRPPGPNGSVSPGVLALVGVAVLALMILVLIIAFG